MKSEIIPPEIQDECKSIRVLCDIAYANGFIDGKKEAAKNMEEDLMTNEGINAREHGEIGNN